MGILLPHVPGRMLEDWFVRCRHKAAGCPVGLDRRDPVGCAQTPPAAALEALEPGNGYHRGHVVARFFVKSAGCGCHLGTHHRDAEAVRTRLHGPSG